MFQSFNVLTEQNTHALYWSVGLFCCELQLIGKIYYLLNPKKLVSLRKVNINANFLLFALFYSGVCQMLAFYKFSIGEFAKTMESLATLSIPINLKKFMHLTIDDRRIFQFSVYSDVSLLR